MTKKIKEFILRLLISGVIVAIILCIFTGISCRLTPEGIKILTGDFESPKLVSFDIESSNKVRLEFSEQVTLKDVSVTEKKSTNEVSVTQTDLGDGTWNIEFSEKMDCAKLYEINVNVIDSGKNTLYFKNSFQGFNDRIPKVIINEIYVSSKTTSAFVELFVLKDGNIGGMELILASNGNGNSYILPSAEVKEGEYIVIHLKKIDKENCVDEVGDDITECKASDATEGRDFWVENTSNAISVKQNDVILLKTRIKGELEDAVLFCESEKDWDSKKPYITECAKLAFDSRIWPGGYDKGNAACSDGLTATSTTRSFSRQGIENGKDAWIVTTKKGTYGTPGTENLTSKK